ncbi:MULTISPECIES: glucose-6-phosphate isomerase [Prochlorococcus]|uniref:glucose-6-phosphate isomerase n=1 Tax=Prochlorococcus TaxID=1218 RepID=UPI00053378E0|nr:MULTISPECIES: glucose-6-phosphate isomerase [Prochlorococcus]KGG12470.1 Glucose-6-phosphate isomerase [Prochlorococcus sp. MIT 0601]
MNLPDFNPTNSQDQWNRFKELLWHDEQLGFWLDISRMKINKNHLEELEPKFIKAFEALSSLENGSIANQDEKRMVGHYWLRCPELAPTLDITKLISEEIDQIIDFSKGILSSLIKTEEGESFTDVLWIGIGGSGLGPLLITQSLQELNQGLNFHFLDNVDPIGLEKTLNSLGENISKTLFVVVSKSGGTPEPQIAMDQARNYVKNKNLQWSSRAVAVTMQGSRLYNLATSEGWLKSFDLPDWVGGRTSITGAVGLLPLGLINSDIKSFLLGASKMDLITRNTIVSENPSALLASAWYSSGKARGLKDMVVLPYRDSLEVFSRYLQQLVMESLGKKLDRNSKEVCQGLAVYGNKGSTDQHAYVQQLRDGLDNFFVTFIEVLTDNNLPLIQGKSPGDFLSGFFQGTRLALSQNNRESITISIKKFDPCSLGALIALFERAVGLYAELININAYHQPGVEAGKKAAADVLFLQSKVEQLLLDGKTYSIEELSTEIEESSPESIFLILRHLTSNSQTYAVNGLWSKPGEITITRTT